MLRDNVMAGLRLLDTPMLPPENCGSCLRKPALGAGPGGESIWSHGRCVCPAMSETTPTEMADCDHAGDRDLRTELGVPYLVGGSVASGVHGEARRHA